MLLGVFLAVGTGLLVPAITAAVAYLLVRDAPVDATTDGALTARRLAGVDPNEAARAVGSWG
jgi:hypothetical protein